VSGAEEVERWTAEVRLLQRAVEVARKAGATDDELVAIAETHGFTPDELAALLPPADPA
jgi:hypothetical protein